VIGFFIAASGRPRSRQPVRPAFSSTAAASTTSPEGSSAGGIVEHLLETALFLLVLFLLLGSGLWIGLALLGVALVGMWLFTTRPAGDAMITTIWTASSSWTLTALPLFIWMGEILFRTRLSEDMFKGLSPWVAGLPGRLLHTNVVGCTIFAAVSGSSAATCATIGKMTIPELSKRGYPDGLTVGSLAGAGTLGLMIPPSLTMIVYGVAVNESIAALFMGRVFPGLVLALLFMGYVMGWALVHRDRVPPEPTCRFANGSPPRARSCPCSG
jgi:TRAP-type C4-dicarboxylate transport system, large permease component